MRSIIALVLVLFFAGISYAQESIHAEHGLEESLKGSHRLSLGLGHTHITEENINEGNNWLGVTSWSLNYDYWLSNKFGLGLQTDVLFENFLVESNAGELVERSFPIAVMPVALYKVSDHFSLLAGGGMEYSKERNIVMSRVGLEYGLPISGGKEFGVALVWDNNWKHYNSIAISFAISNIFSK